MQINVFKLITGEEIIARTAEAPAQIGLKPISYQIEKPRIIGINQAPEGLSLSLTPWLLGNVNADIVIPAISVIVTYKPSDRLEKVYLEQTSGLKL
jgi:hypothetical protein